MPQIGGGFILGDDEKKKKPPAPTGPSPHTTRPGSQADAIGMVEKASSGALPTSVTLRLTSQDRTEAELRRAAKRLARELDVEPIWLYGEKRLDQMRDPLTGNLLVSLSTLRRYGEPLEPQYWANFLRPFVEGTPDKARILIRREGIAKRTITPGVEGVPAKRIADVVESMGILDGWNISANEAVGAAYAAAARLKGNNVSTFRNNLIFVHTFLSTRGLLGQPRGKDDSYNWQFEMALAAESAKRGVVFRSQRDVLAVLSPEATGLTQLAEENAEAVEKIRALRERLGSTEAVETALRTGVVPGQETAGLPGSVDPDVKTIWELVGGPGAAGPTPQLMSVLPFFADFGQGDAGTIKTDEFEGDALEYAEAIVREVEADEEAFQNNPVNKAMAPIFAAFRLANRPFQGLLLAGKFAGDLVVAEFVGGFRAGHEREAAALYPGGPDPIETAKELWNQYGSDLNAALQDKLRLADTLVRDYGINRVVAEGTEFLLGWYIDPIIVGGKLAKIPLRKGVYPALYEKSGSIRPLAATREYIGWAFRSPSERAFFVNARDIDRYADQVERVRAYNNAVHQFADDTVDTLHDVFQQSLDDPTELIKFQRRWRVNFEGRTPWDPSYLEHARQLWVSKYGRKGASSAAARKDVRDIIVAHFTAKPLPRTLAEEAWRIRETNRIMASQRIRDANPQLALFDDAGRMVRERLDEMAANADDYYHLPLRMEIPKKTRPIPGFGAARLAGAKFVESPLGDTALGRGASALLSVDPQNILKFHAQPEITMRRIARRMRYGDDVVRDVERRTAQAGGLTGVRREDFIKAIKDDLYDRFIKDVSRPLGWQDDVIEKVIKDELQQAEFMVNKRAFGARQVGGPAGFEGAVRIERPLGSAQLRNEIAILDPVEIRRVVHQATGDIRRMRAAFVRSFGKDPRIISEVSKAFPMRRFLSEKVARQFFRFWIRAWKLGAVARPAYILRVVLGEELVRSFAVTESAYEQVMSFGLGKLGRKLDDAGYMTRRYLFAAEGKPMTLARRQVTPAQVKTEFAGTRVVDPNGEPLIVYHGTPNHFERFDIERVSPESWYGPGFYHSESTNAANGYAKTSGAVERRFATAEEAEAFAGPNGFAHQSGNQWVGVNPGQDAPNIRPAYLNIRNPLDMEIPLTAEIRERWLAGLEIRPGQTFPQPGAGMTNGKFYRALEEAFDKETINRAIENAGFDGIRYQGGQRLGRLTGQEPHTVWVAFKPDQILPGFKDIEVIRSTGKGAIGFEAKRPGAYPANPFSHTHLNVRELSDDLLSRSTRRELALRESGSWGLVDPDDPQYLYAWSRALGKQFYHSPGTRKILGHIEEGWTLDRIKAEMKQWVHTPSGRAEMSAIGRRGWEFDDWADGASEVVWGYTLGQREIAGAAHIGAVDELEELLAKYHSVAKDQKLVVHGPLVQRVAGDLRRGVMDRWYGLMVRNPENFINRERFTRTWKGRAERAYAEMVEGSGVTVPKDIAKRIDAASDEFSLAMTKRIMFDFTENSRLGQMLTPVFPFMQPFVENIAVWGHILTKRNPALVGYVNRIAQFGVQSGFIQKDEDTGEWVIPETWFLATVPLLWMFGGAGQWSLSTRLTSLNLFVNSSMPIMGLEVPVPSFAPWVGVPLQRFWDDRQAPDWLKGYLYQFGPGPEVPPGTPLGETALSLTFRSLLPRWSQYALQGIPGVDRLVGTSERKAAVGDFLTMQQFLGQEPDPELAERQGTAFMWYRALTSAIFPGSPIIKFPQAEVETEWHDLVEEVQDYDKARDIFLKRYPQFSLITIGKTASERLRAVYDPETGTYRVAKPGEETVLEAPGVRPQASALAEALISAPRFREFANDPATSMWAAALMIQSTNPKANDFDPGVFARQVMSGKVYYKTAREMWEDDQERKAWDTLRTVLDGFSQVEEQLLEAGFDVQDEKWRQLVTEPKAAELADIARNYPVLVNRGVLEERDDGIGFQFSYDSKELGPFGVNPLILQSVAAVLESKEVAGLPAIEGLRSYWAARQEMVEKLQAKGLTGLEHESATKLKGEWESTVAGVIEEFPEFEVFYNTWFRSDLSLGVPTKGRQKVEKWKAANDPRYEVFVNYDSRLEQFTERAAVAKATGDRIDLSRVYQNRNAYITTQWTEHKDVVLAHFNEMTNAERAQEKAGLLTKPLVFYSPLDWHVMGVKLSKRAAEWLNAIGEAELEIREFKAETEQPTGDMHAKVDEWVRRRLGKDKSFAAAVEAQNTWGWQAIANGYTAQPGKTGWAWENLIETANGLRRQVEQRELHGDDSRAEFDPDNRLLYRRAREALMDYVNELREWSPHFKAQWDEMAADYQDPLGEWLMPPVWFPLGGR